MNVHQLRFARRDFYARVWAYISSDLQGETSTHVYERTSARICKKRLRNTSSRSHTNTSALNKENSKKNIKNYKSIWKYICDFWDSHPKAILADSSKQFTQRSCGLWTTGNVGHFFCFSQVFLAAETSQNLQQKPSLVVQTHSSRKTRVLST